MANTRQGEAASASRRANTYKKIEIVIDQLPNEFLPTQLYKLAGIKDASYNRWLVAWVLEQDFKFRRIGLCGKKRWSKI
jgi:hypothetical protein